MSKNEALQRVWRLYEEENERLAATAREVIEWGVRKGLLRLPDIDPYDILAEDMARALREEYATDTKGRRYRVKRLIPLLPVRSTSCRGRRQDRPPYPYE